MASATTPAIARRLPLSRLRDLALPLGLIGALLVIIVPVPPHLLDVLLAANITLAVIILLTTVAIRTPLEFSVFPTLLLVTTLSRLVLNVATTRLILTQGQTDGLWAAGGVVKGFGEFVAGDKLAVGMVIFAILIVIQFVVITKGATRISEVAARFALDGMPGRQMAVDADLAAGVITQTEAQQRRHDITRQADFFGAMDGASKFVRGDAVAGIIITLVNIVGGLAIGIIQGGMSLSDAGSVYTKLTIGDGLVTQIPALLISLAAGLLVTRSSSATDLPRELTGQLFSRPQVLIVAGCFVAALVFTELPRIPLLVLGGSCIGLSWLLTRQNKEAAVAAAEAAKAESQQRPTTPQRIEKFLEVDPLEVEVGLGLVRLADPKRHGDLLERVQRVRQSVAAELGILMPKVRIRDNLRLDQHQYRIRMSDVAIAQGTVLPSQLLAIDAGHVTQPIAGRETRDPGTQAQAVWIDPSDRQRAELSGYKVVEPAGVIVAHLTETVRRHADELLTRDATRHLLDELKQTQPAVVDELIPGQLKLAEVQQVLQLLLREQVSIRQLGPILETLGDVATHTRDPLLLAQHVRQRLARTLSHRYRDQDGTLHVVTLEPELEQQIAAATVHDADGWRVGLPPDSVEQITEMVAEAMEPLSRSGRPSVLLVQPQIRAAVKNLLEPRLPQLVVLGLNEITRDTKVVATAMVEATHTSESSLKAVLQHTQYSSRSA
ncbi:MAG: flagellar biosynthesis protein FlhA [Planctomycetes bacterium]|nr:flagellar biosynthesis protein FlhA [Planctomycetota bacterium]